MKPRPDPEKAGVVLVEDHPMFRERLAQVINRDLGMKVLGEADNIDSALELIEQSKPDIVIVDLTLRGSSGLDLIKAIKARGIPAPVLVLTMHAEARYADRVLRAGARGYVTKEEDSARIIAAIRKVLAGGIYLSEPTTERIIQHFSGAGASVEMNPIGRLTDRELEIYRLFGSGHNSREIADRLSLSENTICTYRQRIKEKLGVKNFTELYSEAARWVQEEEQGR